MKTEVYFIDEETLTEEEMEALADVCEEYSELEEMWFSVKDEKGIPDNMKEEWIGFTYLLLKGAETEVKQSYLLQKLQKNDQKRLAKAVEAFIEAKGKW